MAAGTQVKRLFFVPPRPSTDILCVALTAVAVLDFAGPAGLSAARRPVILRQAVRPRNSRNRGFCGRSDQRRATPGTTAGLRH